MKKNITSALFLILAFILGGASSWAIFIPKNDGETSKTTDTTTQQVENKEESNQGSSNIEDNTTFSSKLYNLGGSDEYWSKGVESIQLETTDSVEILNIDPELKEFFSESVGKQAVTRDGESVEGCYNGYSLLKVYGKYAIAFAYWYGPAKDDGNDCSQRPGGRTLIGPKDGKIQRDLLMIAHQPPRCSDKEALNLPKEIADAFSCQDI